MTVMHGRSANLNEAIAGVCDRMVPDRHDHYAIDLTALAKSLGVVDVLYKASRIHGYTTWGKRGANLFLAMASTEGRRRATLAHECAHLLLNPALDPQDSIGAESRERSAMLLGPELPQLSSAVAAYGIERVCDRIAFELLLPRRTLSSMTPEELSDAQALQSLAVQRRVSLSLVINQANKAGIRVQLVRLARAWDATWLAVDTAGATTNWRAGVCCDEQTNIALDELPVSKDAITMNLRPAAGARDETFSVLRHTRSAIAVMGWHAGNSSISPSAFPERAEATTHVVSKSSP